MVKLTFQGGDFIAFASMFNNIYDERGYSFHTSCCDGVNW